MTKSDLKDNSSLFFVRQGDSAATRRHSKTYCTKQYLPGNPWTHLFVHVVSGCVLAQLADHSLSLFGLLTVSLFKFVNVIVVSMTPTLHYDTLNDYCARRLT